MLFDVANSNSRQKTREFDNPASAPDWTLPRKARRRSGAKRRTSGEAAKQSLRAHHRQNY
jgi:hypothetical protein